jgi:hypothetical protein
MSSAAAAAIAAPGNLVFRQRRSARWLHGGETLKQKQIILGVNRQKKFASAQERDSDSDHHHPLRK